MASPKPRNGWRVFVGEVGVIVLGVLLALGAQQAVEAWQVRKDVRAFRETVNREVGYSYARRSPNLPKLDLTPPDA